MSSINVFGVAYDQLRTADRDALTLPEYGLVIFNTDVNSLQINLGTPAVPAWSNVGGGTDTNTWDMSGVAFVSPDGNNLTAVPGDGNKPYAAVANALDAADTVIMLPGTYSSSVSTVQFTAARDNKHVICMDGVVITGGGVYVYSGTTNVKFTGRAVMDNRFYNGLNILTTDAVNIEFECKAFEDSRTIMWMPSGAQAKIKFKADYLKSSGVNGGGYSVRMLGTAEAIFDIRDFIETHYTSFHTRSGFAGKLIVNCPETRTADIYPFGNPYGTGLNSCLWLDSALDCEIVINGDLVDTRSVVRNAGVVNAANLTNSTLNPTITINGDIKPLNTQGIYSWYRSAFGRWIINGDIISSHTGTGAAGVPIWTQMPGWGGAADQTWIIRGNIQAPNRSVIGMGKKFYVYSPFIYNGDLNGNGGFFFKSNTGSSQQTEVYFYNTKFELGNAPGTSEIVLGDASLAGNIVNSVGVTGTEPTLCSVVVDAWAGYTQLVGLITPKV